MKKSHPRMRVLAMLALILALLIIPTTAFADGPTILTAQTDYEPGDTVSFRGSGFSWGETVNLAAVGSSNGSRINSQVTADIFGNIAGSFVLPIMFEATYSLTATGTSSGLVATGSFYDFVTAFNIVSPVSAVTLNPGQTQLYTILAKTQANNPVPGVAVNWTATGGMMAPASSTTDSNGNASSTYTAGSTPGSFTITATAPGAGQNGNDKVSTQAVTINPPPDSTPPVITYTLTPSSPDGANGWYKSNVTLVWSVTDPESAVTKTGCVDQNITADQAATTYSCSATSAGGSTGPVSVTIKRDATAPTNVSGTAARPSDHDGWYNHPVGVTFSGQDATSGIASCTSGTYSGPDTATASIAGSCTDNAGNTANGSFTFKYDASGPSASLAVTVGTLGAHQWYTSDVTVHTSGTDAVSGIESCTPDQFQTAETTGATFNGSCTNGAGLTTNASPLTVKLDKTGPTATLSAVGTLGNNGWYVSDVTIKTTGSDTISNPTTCTPDQSQTTDTASATFNGSCTNDAGLKTDAASLTIKRDATKPTLNITGAASGAYGVCTKPSRPTFAPTDSLSGVASSSDSWTVPSTPSGVGTYTYTATATDKAGNTVSDTRTYNVTYGGAFGGFLQPINMDNSSRFKLGSTVPVKFQLICGTTPIANATAWLYVAQGDSMPDPGVDEAISTAASTTGNLFRYDSTAQQYIFNLSTKLGYVNPDGTTISAFAAGTWTLKIKLDDGSWHSINIQLPK